MQSLVAQQLVPYDGFSHSPQFRSTSTTIPHMQQTCSQLFAIRFTIQAMRQSLLKHSRGLAPRGLASHSSSSGMRRRWIGTCAAGTSRRCGSFLGSEWLVRCERALISLKSNQRRFNMPQTLPFRRCPNKPYALWVWVQAQIPDRLSCFASVDFSVSTKVSRSLIQNPEPSPPAPSPTTGAC